jgi:hypothetical protein
VFVFFEPGEASPRQQAWQPALRVRRVILLKQLMLRSWQFSQGLTLCQAVLAKEATLVIRSLTQGQALRAA